MTSTGTEHRLPSVALVAAACMLALGLSLSTTAPAQIVPLTEERSHVLQVLGFVEELNANLFPASDTAGVIARQPVSEPEAESVRLHFQRLNAGSLRDDWEVQVRQGERVAWRFTAADLVADGIWSDEIEGERVTVELVSQVPDNPVQLRLDLVAAIKPQVTPESITGEDQRTPIGVQAPWVKAIGRSVARLRFIGDDRKIYTCTGFLITRELMLTNQHCIASESELRSALVDFDFDTDLAETLFMRLRELLSTDHGLDYAVVRLATPIEDREPLAFSAAPSVAGQPLLIIQHPGGEPKQVSIQDCRVGELVIEGRGGTGTDFTHLCDTLGGSSGSPVIAVESRQVVGLHHLGFEDDSPVLLNRAVHISQVLSHLPSELRAELDIAPTPP